MQTRSQGGSYLVETLIACVVGAILILAMYGQLTAILRQGTSNQNQILATNIAQQLMDNARNSSWSNLTTIASDAQWQSVPLYGTAQTDNTTLFPRALLQNTDLVYSDAAKANTFKGAVRQKLSTVEDPAGTLIKLQIEVTWADSRGSGHKYETETLISQSGIHN